MLHLDLVHLGTPRVLTHLNLQHQLDLVHHFPPLPSKQSGKDPSIVWQHFIKLASPDPKKPSSKCKYCKNQYNCHGKKNGNLGMLHHMEVCKKWHFSHDDKQKIVFLS